MPYDTITQIQTYKWTPYNKDNGFGNKLPFNWKCCVCGKTTELIENDPSKTYDCDNTLCPVKLKFTI